MSLRRDYRTEIITPLIPPALGAQSRGGKIPRRIGHNLSIRLPFDPFAFRSVCHSIRLRDFRSNVLRFIFDFRLPFTNTIADQSFRTMKVNMKISGGFRTLAGAQTSATLRSVISTARKQGWNILDTLIAHPQLLIIELSGSSGRWEIPILEAYDRSVGINS